MPLSERLILPASRWISQTSGMKRRHLAEHPCGTCNPLRMQGPDFCSTSTGCGTRLSGLCGQPTAEKVDFCRPAPVRNPETRAR